MKLPKSKTVLVLDLDDTLCKEIEYVHSGLKHVAELIEKLIGFSLLDEILKFRESEPNGDVLQFACKEANLPNSVKESLLWAYRLHAPEVRLEPEIRQWLDECRSGFFAVAILTDGRSITQRLKLKELGLLNLPLYISEEWNSTKLDQIRFLAIQDRWQGKQYVYVGDNSKTDFLSPNLLGWTTIGLLNAGQNIHSQDLRTTNLSENDTNFKPDFWVSRLIEVSEIIC